MVLYDLLSNRSCINILKILYDEEANRRGYTLNLSAIKARLSLGSSLLYETGLLMKEGLISSEKVENDVVLSITGKGKAFIGAFDGLIKVMNSAKESKQESKPHIEYELAEFEKRILLFTYKITKEKASPITISELTQELFPYQEAKSKKNSVARHVKKLSALNLIEKIKDGNKDVIMITESGKRVVKEQFMKIVL